MSDLEVGMEVRKVNGYAFPCTVLCVFYKLDGAERVVCESHATGRLQIFAPRELVPVDAKT